MGPSVTTPTRATAAPSPSNRTANMRGAVPAPKENPCMPCRSLEAHSAKMATAHSTSPPTKSCGHLTQLGMMDLPALALGVSLIELSPLIRAVIGTPAFRLFYRYRAPLRASCL